VVERGAVDSAPRRNVDVEARYGDPARRVTDVGQRREFWDEMTAYCTEYEAMAASSRRPLAADEHRRYGDDDRRTMDHPGDVDQRAGRRRYMEDQGLRHRSDVERRPDLERGRPDPYRQPDPERSQPDPNRGRPRGEEIERHLRDADYDARARMRGDRYHVDDDYRTTPYERFSRH